MKKAIILLALLCAGCGLFGVQSPSNPDPRAIARGVVETMKDVWITGSTICLQQQDKSKCAPAFDQAHTDLLTLASAVDTWDDAAQANYPCLAFALANDARGAVQILSDAGVKMPNPQIVDQGLSLASMIAGSCVQSDAGSD